MKLKRRTCKLNLKNLRTKFNIDVGLWSKLKIEETKLGITLDDVLKTLSKDRRDQIKSSQVVILPINFEDIDNIDKQPFRDRAITVNKLLKNENIKSELLEGEEHRQILELRGFDFLMPTILFVVADPTARSVVINIISEIIYDGLKFLTRKNKEQTPLELEFVRITKDGSLTSIKYQGSAEDFGEISKKLKSLGD